MKILLLGDASNCHCALAAGLRAKGCDVTLMSEGGGFMHTDRDIDVSRHLPGKFGGLELWTRLHTTLRPRLKGYDVVAVTNPVFVSLRPERLRPIFYWLKEHNKRIFLTALGTDPALIEECMDPVNGLRYSEFRQQGQPGPEAVRKAEDLKIWMSAPLKPWCDEFYSQIDGAVTVLYEYQRSVARRLPPEKIHYGGIPIDIQGITPVDIPATPSPIRILLGRHRHRQTVKGTDRMEIALRRAMEMLPGRAQMELIENVPYKEYLQHIRSSHLVLDQAYSYTPATSALLAMAHGIPVVSGGEPEFYDFIGQPATPGVTPCGIGADGTGFTPGDIDPLRPVINCPIDVDGMTEMFCHILRHPEILAPLGRASRTFVERHNAAPLVAERFLRAWA